MSRNSVLCIIPLSISRGDRFGKARNRNVWRNFLFLCGLKSGSLIAGHGREHVRMYVYPHSRRLWYGGVGIEERSAWEGSDVDCARYV